METPPRKRGRRPSHSDGVGGGGGGALSGGALSGGGVTKRARTPSASSPSASEGEPVSSKRVRSELVPDGVNGRCVMCALRRSYKLNVHVC